jgi:nucleoside-diphosphate-sugar epimerase
MGLPVPSLSLRYQMVDVEDVASATALALSGSEKGVQILNIGAFSISIDDFVRDLKKSSGSKSLLVKIPLRVLVFGALFLDYFNLSPLNREQVSFLRKPVEINFSKTAASLNWVPKHNFPRHDDDFRFDAR